MNRSEWEESVLKPALAKTPERCDRFETASGLPLPRVALPATPDADYAGQLGLPGAYPFTRGIHPTMYRGRLWTMRQYAGYSTAEETNQRFRFLLEQGTTGLSMAFDLPTQIGYDSDDPIATGEVGKVGVAIDSVADLERVFDGLPLDRVSTSMTINATAAILLAMYVVAAERRGVAWNQLRGTLQNDILKEYIARGTYIFPPGPSLRLTTDTIAWCLEHTPGINPVSISGYHIREAGSTAVQEVAFTLADAVAYIEAARGAGLRLEDFGAKLSFFFNASSDFLEEAAKFRAARRLYARLVRERFGCAVPECQALRFHTQTAGHTLTAVQTEVNVVRVTLQALAAVLGGTQSLHTNARDEAQSLPTEESARLALRIQQLIAAESGVCHTIDPLGGSYLVEQLTDRIEEEARTLIARIDQLGGMPAAIASGWVQQEIEVAAYHHQCEVESGERKIVGVNCHVVPEQSEPAVFRPDPAVELAQVARLRERKARRDSEKVRTALADVRLAAEGTTNLLGPIIAAVRVEATVGEICGVLRQVWGEHKTRMS
ncbi:MAG: methylmalonyl-CoA mutase [Opitutae bacterium]|nr:methylmalonyl-CoA mutase [Opitutae bacterium]